MSNLDAMNKRADALLAKARGKAAAQNESHYLVVEYNPATGLPLAPLDDRDLYYQYGQVWLPKKVYLFDPNDDGSEP